MDVTNNTRIVTVHILRKTTPGQSSDLQAKVSHILDHAATEDGFLGSGVLKGILAGENYLSVLLHFANRELLEKWRSTNVARESFDDALQHVIEDPVVEIAEGAVGWFELPNVPMVIPPPKWKMAIVTWLAIFPILSVFILGTTPMMVGLPPLLRIFLNTLMIAPIMTWLAMPAMTRLFRRWLFSPN